MITPGNFVDKWKDYPLSKLDNDSFAKEYFSEPDREFLIQAGLPGDAYLGHLTFDLSEPKRHFFDHNLKEVSEDNHSKKYLQIGEKHGNPICVNLETGEVDVLWTKLNKIEFISSSINQLVELIIVFNDVFDKFREEKIDRESSKTIKTEIDHLINEANRVDRKSLVGETIWTIMIEDLRQLLNSL